LACKICVDISQANKYPIERDSGTAVPTEEQAQHMSVFHSIQSLTMQSPPPVLHAKRVDPYSADPRAYHSFPQVNSNPPAYATYQAPIPTSSRANYPPPFSAYPTAIIPAETEPAANSQNQNLL